MILKDDPLTPFRVNLLGLVTAIDAFMPLIASEPPKRSLQFPLEWQILDSSPVRYRFERFPCNK